MALSTYTESVKVKSEAWMDKNTDIPLSVYDESRVDAYGLIRSMLAWKYDLTDIDADTSIATAPAGRLLNTIERIYAAWLFLQREFWHEEASVAEWKDKVAQAERWLDRILDSKDRLVLIWSDGDEYLTVSASPAGWPSMTWITDWLSSATPDFCKTDIF